MRARGACLGVAIRLWAPDYSRYRRLQEFQLPDSVSYRLIEKWLNQANAPPHRLAAGLPVASVRSKCRHSQMTGRLRVSEFENKYGQFQLTPEKCDSLRWLADPRSHLPHPRDRVIVETVIVEHGERRTVKREEQDAKLV